MLDKEEKARKSKLDDETKRKKEEEERKKTKDEEIAKKQIEEEKTRMIHSEKSKSYLEKTDSMTLRQRIDYFYSMFKEHGWTLDLNWYYKNIKELVVTNDEKYLFRCI